MAKPFKSKRPSGGGGRFGGDRGDRKGFGAKSFGGKKPWDRDAAAPMMHKATCAQCGEFCQVPFKPNGSKPVLCSFCFKKTDDRGPVRSFSDRRPAPSSAPSPVDRAQMRVMNEKLDAILSILRGEELE